MLHRYLFPSLLLCGALVVPPALAEPTAPPGAAPSASSSVAPPAASASSAAPQSSAAPVPTPVLGPPLGVYQRANTWDLNVEGGYGKELGSGGKWLGWGRVRAGLLLVREPRYLMLGVTAELAARQTLTLGFQGEVVDSVSGLWLQAGPTLDIKGHLGGALAAGISFFGAEVQRRHVDGLGDATIVLGKVRVPIGVIAFAASH